MPYVYLIGWSVYNVYYYGVRYSKYAYPNDLFVTYFSSSAYVKKMVHENGPPDIIQVRKVFNSGNYEFDKTKALRWETTVLRRLNVVQDSRFLNRWDNNMFPLNTTGPFPFQNESIQQKANDTLLRKYGVRGSGAPSILQKVMKTNIKKYGETHTLNVPQVKNARDQTNLQKYGSINPFDNNKKLQEVMIERYGVHNMMLLPEIKFKHKQTMQNFDWSERNSKSKQTNLQKYGNVNPLNTPERIEQRKQEKKPCPYGCKENHLFDRGNFSKHMMRYHSWTRPFIYDYFTGDIISK